MNKTETKTKSAKKKVAKKVAKKKEPKVKKLFGPDIYKRDEHGLLKNVEYHFNEDGSVDWRSMIKPKFLYPNKGWFDMRGQTVPTSIDGLKDNQLLIMLGGIKDLARLRGFHSVSFQTNSEPDYVTSRCLISWTGNYESGGDHIHYEDVANATADNTDDFCYKFLETIACNRAFVRCVRNFLNINIVGADEIDKSNPKDEKNRSSGSKTTSNAPITPSALLKSKSEAKYGTDSFESFKDVLRELWTSGTYINEDVKNWSSFDNIPAKEARKLIGIISK